MSKSLKNFITIDVSSLVRGRFIKLNVVFGYAHIFHSHGSPLFLALLITPLSRFQ